MGQSLIVIARWLVQRNPAEPVIIRAIIPRQQPIQPLAGPFLQPDPGYLLLDVTDNRCPVPPPQCTSPYPGIPYLIGLSQVTA
jgi:hypothetical protein